MTTGPARRRRCGCTSPGCVRRSNRNAAAAARAACWSLVTTATRSAPTRPRSTPTASRPPSARPAPASPTIPTAPPRSCVTRSTCGAGSALQDFTYDEFARADIARLEELRLDAVETRVEADLRRGLASELVGELETLSQQHPLRERPVAQLMHALYRSGRQAEALRAFERYRRRLGEDLGLEPSPELRRLEEQILLHDARLAPPAVARSTVARRRPTRSRVCTPSRRPTPTTSSGATGSSPTCSTRLGDGARLVALVGPSGSGKSSVVRAGVVPALRKGALPGSERWLVASMVPGAHPFAELEAALLRSTIDAPNSLDAQLADPTLGLLRAALRLLPDDTARLVLLIDQFEELFTLVDDEAERRRFLDNLVAAVDDPQGRVLVVLTLRADSYHRPLAYGEFAARLGPGVINVLPLTTDELEEAAQEPAAHRGVTFEPALLAELLTDVIGEPGALPLFQYALTELFDRRDGRPAHARRLPLDGRRARRAQPAGRRPVPPSDARRAGGRPPAVPAPGDDHRAGAVEPATRAGVGDRGDRRRRGDDGVGDRRARPAPLPVVRPRPRHGRADGRGRPRGAAVGVGPAPRMDRRGSRSTSPGAPRSTRRSPSGASPGATVDYLLGGKRLAEYERWRATTSMRLTTAEQEYLDASLARRDDDARPRRREPPVSAAWPGGRGAAGGRSWPSSSVWRSPARRCSCSVPPSRRTSASSCSTGGGQRHRRADDRRARTGRRGTSTSSPP